MSHYNHKGRPGLVGGSLPRNNLGQLFSILKGGPKSGNFGHSGRLGKRGGSSPSSRQQIHDLSTIVDNFYGSLKRHHGTMLERQDSAAKEIGYSSYDDYRNDVYKRSTTIPGGSEIGKALREDFFGEGYGKEVYEKMARGDFSGTPGIVKSLANAPMNPINLVRIDSSLSPELKKGSTFSLGGPKAFTVHDTPGVFSGQKIIVEKATRGTRVSLYSPYPQEGEVFSESPKGYKVKQVLDDGAYVVEML